MNPINPASAEREALIASLRAELLGPRGGILEELPAGQNPRDEYITGVLAPRGTLPEIEGDEVLLPNDPNPFGSEIGSGEASGETDNDDVVIASKALSPSLDPRALPNSLGVSFVIANQESSPASILCSWARYQEEEDNTWTRKPEHSVLQGKVLTDGETILLAADVELRVRTNLLHDGLRVSLYLLNSAPSHERPRVEELIFQPQIRVNLGEDDRLIPLSNSPALQDGVGAADLDAPWRSRQSFARGHLCSAVWREIDFEVTDGTSPAFEWIDGQALPRELREQFERPTVRSEYIPTYEVRNPDYEWPSDKPKPELSAAVLAQTYDPDLLRAKLRPLTDVYRDWIETQRRGADIPQPHREEDLRNLGLCDELAARLERAIDVLATDHEARLAFCFANRAIALQAEWQGFEIAWRPFQLAFLLLNVPSIAYEDDPERDVCDLLHFPTGGGKTEAYLALMAFSMAHRRLKNPGNGSGTTIISRYTLRLLTIQQFRRTTRLIAACEFLRVDRRADGGFGWLPAGVEREGRTWGGARFSIGLWVGGGVTPNQMVGFNAPASNRRLYRFAGAIDLLKGIRQGYDGPDQVLRNELSRVAEIRGLEAEPAQVLTCPACSAMLAVPAPSLPTGEHKLHFVVRAPGLSAAPDPELLRSERVDVADSELATLEGANPTYRVLTVTIRVSDERQVTSRDIDGWFYERVEPELGTNGRLESVRPSRMGYFVESHPAAANRVNESDFAIVCPSPSCRLDALWQESVPYAEDVDAQPSENFRAVPEPFRHAGSPYASMRVPITAYTIDEQVYRRVPTVLIATVDKFARLTDDPSAGTLFGNVDFYHARYGYYRENAPPWPGRPPRTAQSHPLDPRGTTGLRVPVEPLPPPSLIIQDELHLIDGPLGSMAGVFEAVLDLLCRQTAGPNYSVKYIASTATASQAAPQVRSVFDRDLRVFPAPGIEAQNSFFQRTDEGDPTDGAAGRIYVGVAAIGRGPQTPTVRIWSNLLGQVASDRASGMSDEGCDPFWTVVGYFNAIRELASGRALLRADVPQRLGPAGRQLERDALELSGRTESLELPRILDQLEHGLPDPEAVDALVTTSMFGTGIDVSRLGLMIVHGQPKTTSAYIQATGRVGRGLPALVVTFLRAGRPRDLDHYEFFNGYHRALGRWVEPVTVAPFAPRTCERILGPAQVALLRQARSVGGFEVPADWRTEQRVSGGFFSSARLMATRRNDPIMAALGTALEERASHQPDSRRPPDGYVRQTAGNELDRWRQLAQQHDHPDQLVYREPAMTRPPTRAVVLGDPQHFQQQLDQAFRDAPNSMREVEGTLGIYVP